MNPFEVRIFGFYNNKQTNKKTNIFQCDFKGKMTQPSSVTHLSRVRVHVYIHV